MHLKHKIAQMLMLGFKGKELTTNNPILQDIVNLQIGGVILFDRDPGSLALNQRNIESPIQVKTLTQSLQNESEIPLLIGLDYEGGDKNFSNKRLGVSRLNTSYGFPATYTAKEFTQLSNDEKQQIANIMAETVKEAGINTVFAPVVDIDIFPGESCIGLVERAFGSEVETVIQSAQYFLSAYHNKQILTCLKHFPGYGSARKDAHFNPSDVSETWNEIELEPYYQLIREAPLIMTTHVQNRQLDASGLPATLSPLIVEGLLRNKLGYEGVIITDDLQMQAILQSYSLEETLRLSILAGHDILLFGNMLEYQETIAIDVINIILELISQGKLSEQRIDASFERIMKMKKKIHVERMLMS